MILDSSYVNLLEGVALWWLLPEYFLIFNSLSHSIEDLTFNSVLREVVVVDNLRGAKEGLTVLLLIR